MFNDPTQTPFQEYDANMIPESFQTPSYLTPFQYGTRPEINNQSPIYAGGGVIDEEAEINGGPEKTPGSLFIETMLKMNGLPGIKAIRTYDGKGGFEFKATVKGFGTFTAKGVQGKADKKGQMPSYNATINFSNGRLKDDQLSNSIDDMEIILGHIFKNVVKNYSNDPKVQSFMKTSRGRTLLNNPDTGPYEESISDYRDDKGNYFPWINRNNP